MFQSSRISLLLFVLCCIIEYSQQTHQLGGFNTVVAPTSIPFYPNSTYFPGFPTVTINGTIYPSVGYQCGDLVNGKVLYYPWAVTPSGSINWGSSIANAVPQGVMLSYNGGSSGTYTDPTNWSWFDLSTINANAVGYVGAAVFTNLVLLAPAAINKSPVFVRYNAANALVSTSFSTYPAPARGTTLGANYGWCTAVAVGTYAYYVPSFDTGGSLTSPYTHGNIVRFNTSLSIFAYAANWENYNMALIDSTYTGFQSAAYDGHRYLYFMPYVYKPIVRFDTTANFIASGSYTGFDPTQLGTGTYPPVAGSASGASAANLIGFTGATIQWESTGTSQYLISVPWGSATLVPKQLYNTFFKVKVGKTIAGVWSPTDFTTSSGSWEMFDFANLTYNVQWHTGSGWPAPPVVFGSSSPFSGQSQVAGYQMNYINTASGYTKVGFAADYASWYFEHNVSTTLNDPSGWYVGLAPSNLQPGAMGGGYDPVNQKFYPATTNAPLIQISGI